jgi:hypothetical protein
MTGRAAPTPLVMGLFVLCVLLSAPWTLNVPSAGLDGSWMVVMSHALENGWQFGRDIVFTFGPYGFLYTRLNHPQTYAITLAFWSFYGIAVAGTVAWFMRGQRVTAACIVLLLLLLLGTRIPDAALLLVPLLLLFSYAAPARFFVPVLLALTALIALVKFTFALLGFAIILLIEIHRAFQGRRAPYYLLSYLALSLFFFTVAGQDPRNFATYISASLSVAHGYGEAMQIDGPVGEVVCFFGLAACFIGCVFHVEVQRERAFRGFAQERGLVLTLGICLFTYVGMKAGFVRHDAHHSVLAWSSLTVGAAAYSLFVLPNVWPPLTRAALLGICTVSATAALIRAAELAQPSLKESLAQGVLEQAIAVSSLLRGDYAAQQASSYARASETIRNNHPLPRLPGSADIYPWDQSALIAHGMEYQPRPVFQSYGAYNSSLIELNRDHIRGDRAAAFLLFDVKTIDARMPSMDEGQLWWPARTSC